MLGSSDKQKFKTGNLPLGILYVSFGACSYGMLSTFVKLAYKQNYSTAEVIVAQFAWGILLLSIINHFTNKNNLRPSTSDIWKLLVAGAPLGLTSIFYYTSVKYINASVAVVLLMQSVWIGVLVEAIQTKRWPSLAKIAGVVLVLFGTVLATNVLQSSQNTLDLRGVFFGCLSAMAFSATLFATSRVGSHLPPTKRSQIMVCGGAVMVTLFALVTQILPYYFNLELIAKDLIQSKPFHFQIFFSYGFIVAFFGTFVPPMMLNRGFPIVGVGLGSIISSLELPCAMTIAYMLLGEVVNPTQWFGVVVILSAIVLLNFKLLLQPT